MPFPIRSIVRAAKIVEAVSARGKSNLVMADKE
jgi:hypothetical protein